MKGRRTAEVRLQRCGSTVSIHKYVGDGVLFPTIAWLKDEIDQYWMVELQRPARMTDILPRKCNQQPGEELFSKNEQQQKLKEEQDQKSDNLCHSLLQILRRADCMFEVSSDML